MKIHYFATEKKKEKKGVVQWCILPKKK